MAADLYKAMAEYLETIHTTLIWPTLAVPQGRPTAAARTRTGPATKPDRLVVFSTLLMMTYRKAVVIFNPVVLRCNSNEDCDQNEECIKGVCTPISSPSPLSGVTQINPKALSAWRCNSNEDCDQGEECIGGICVPIPFDMAFGAVSTVPTYGDDLKSALEAYYDAIFSVLVQGLAGDPTKLPAVRDLLMQTYAGAARAAGVTLMDCASGGCSDTSACVDGLCVPIPFRLVFKRRGASASAPWI